MDVRIKNSRMGGVWIFLILGGYLNGCSFANGKYNLNKHGIFNFYKKRFFKTLLPTFFFIFVCWILSFPDFLFNNPSVLIQFITLSYRGNPGVNGIGACWYVFTLIPLYLLTPLIAVIFKKTKIEEDNKKLFFVFIALAITGLVCRNYIYLHDGSWYDDVYTKSLMNIDLYFGGFIVSYILRNIDWDKKAYNIASNYIQLISKIVLILTILINSYIYNKISFSANPIWFRIYGYCFETIYLIICSFYFYAHYWPKYTYDKISTESIIKNPFRIIDCFAKISFEFYLFHSLVLDRISPYVPFVNGSLSHHFSLVLISFTISLILALGYHKIYEN